MKYKVIYTVYENNEEVHHDEIDLLLDSPEGAIDVLNEQPLGVLTNGKLKDPIENVTLEVNYVID